MRLGLRARLVAVAIVTAVALPACGAFDADLVVGSGTIPITVRSSTVLVDLSVDARSDGSGDDPTGTVDLVIKITGGVLFSGPVTCMSVAGNTAVIGLEDTTGPVTFVIVDNHAAGIPDTVTLIRDPTPCSVPDSLTPTPLVSGDFAVHDARSTPGRLSAAPAR